MGIQDCLEDTVRDIAERAPAGSRRAKGGLEELMAVIAEIDRLKPHLRRLGAAEKAELSAETRAFLGE